MNTPMPALMLGLNSLVIETWNLVRKSSFSAFDFEPYDEFQSRDETDETIFNGYEYEGHESIIEQFLVFGQDGTGGGYAIWIKDKNANILDQPIVLFDSEGDNIGIASSFHEFIWLNCIYHDRRGNKALIPSRKAFALNNAGHLAAYFDEIDYDVHVVREKARRMNEDFTVLMDQVYETIFCGD
jgi:hypothetical protein